MGSSKNNSRAIIIMRLEMREKHDMKSENKPDGRGGTQVSVETNNSNIRIFE